MDKSLEILEQLEQAKGSNAKKTILKASVGNVRLREILDATFNTFRKYYIKKFDMPVPADNNPEDVHPIFMLVLRMLEERSTTGNAAVRLVEDMFAKMSAAEQKWYNRVLQRDLRAGFTIDTVNKCGFDIKVFDVMLATDGKDCKQLPEMLKKGMFISPKLDGYRCIAEIRDGEVQLLSRSGNVYQNFPQVEAELQKMFPTGSFVFDGEIMCDDNDFQSMQKNAFATVRKTNTTNIVYHMFDYIPAPEWFNDCFVMPASQRYEFLDKLTGDTIKECSHLKVVHHDIVYAYQEALDYEARCVADGYEGAMVLPMDLAYYRGRPSKCLMKLKTMKSQDCIVIDTYEGEGKLVGMLGGFVVRQENNGVCECGSGLTEAKRKQCWVDRESLIGRIVEVQYQDLTGDGIMRFPVFKRFRDVESRKGVKV